MGKLLSWVAIGFAIYVAYKVMLALQRKSALRNRGRASADAGADSPSPAARTKPSDRALTQLVSCAHCGLQLPRDEAVMREGESFCGEPHARLGAGPSAGRKGSD